ncbi:MAG: DUF6092 family protein [Anaerolineae bacterium]|jgi:hypothetical protein
MNAPVLPLEEERYYDLLSFLVSSAFLLSHGEQDEELYPSLRLMDAANRLTKAIVASGGFEEDAWPHEFVEQCESGLNLLMTDQEAFVAFISESTRAVAEEMVRRAAGSAS